MSDLATVARPYAEAVFMVAKEDSQSEDRWREFLYSLKTLMGNEATCEVMSLPELGSEKKTAFLGELAAKILNRDLTKEEENFLLTICDNKRYEILPSVYDEYRMRLLEERNIQEVELQSAYPLTDGQREMFVKALQKRFNKEIELTVTISPSLLGGAILKIDDLVIDGSILGRLDGMIRSMN
ncbi:F0F1 ATP synthase subunit delta [Ignatzschineria larvae DSM 13226]|uniref:ATP synthase subunit delta n=1 Tax=Ignatzschineria larvae DSM 13226 TaxID=1111732 RepID=A0ABZ3BYB1_9GAMM|nr:F0F1 ATP synthase subunit delta [Ignatzschineria larvae]